ncbi:MAG: tryptophan synthase subunit alpha [Bacillota bacterium]|nr:tryptophan synthase subunit alpha [Bacillota bacterium]MDW7684590.1 tryptophan synthase subunit alpha [Bacillota bacterium]
MMNNLSVQLKEQKTAGKKVLIPFLTAGDPDLAVTEQLMAALAKNGADVIELGIPYSDPLADGPVLQLAAGRALAAGTNTDGVFAAVARFRKCYDTPVVLLVYYNIIYNRGVERFCSEAAKAGVNGLVVPDLPFEEAQELDIAAKNANIINIRFLSPTTSPQRLERICKAAEGFIYCVTVTGVTGERAAMDPAVFDMLSTAGMYTDVTLALGFGISTPAQAAKAAEFADAVIVGSALVRRIADTQGTEEKLTVAAAFIRSLKDALEGGNGHAEHKTACC